MGDLVDGKAGENGWGCDGEGGVEGTPESDGSSTGLVLVSRTKVFGLLTVGVEGGRLDVGRTGDSVED